MKNDATQAEEYEFGDFRLDLEERALFSRDRAAIPLTPRVFETLRYLIERPGRIADKQSLMDAVWPDCIVEENNLAQTISTLRRMLGDKNGTQRYIATVPGRGYRFVAEVKARSSPDEGVMTDPVAIGSADPDDVETTKRQSRRGPAPRTRVPFFALVSATLINLAVAYLLWPRSPAVPVAERSIAVLPFANLTADPANTYFADGVKDEILTRLSKIAALKVISRTSTEKFRGAPHNAREIARELGVANILEGSIQQSGETVRVTVQLIHAPTDNHLWAETYDRNLTHMFQVETDVAQRITVALAARLTGSEERALKARPTANAEAYEKYLKGRYFWNKRTIDGYREAKVHLTRAIEIDPGYAQAYAGLADALFFLGGDDPSTNEEAFRRGRVLLLKALELDETLAEAHASLGLLAMNSDWDWPEAERQFKRAIELDPNYATAHQWYGEFLCYMGRFDQAFLEMAQARELDPLSLIISTDVAKIQTLARHYEAAIESYQAALKMDPEFSEAHGLLGLTYSKMGQYEKAIEELQKIRNLDTHPGYLTWLGYAYGVAGRKEEAREVLHRLNELGRQTYVSPFWMAVISTGLGENDEAFRWFDQVFAVHAISGAISLKVNPLFDDLRPDPRFAELLRRAHFEP